MILNIKEIIEKYNLKQISFGNNINNNIKDNLQVFLPITNNKNLETLYIGCDNQKDRLNILKNKSKTKIVIFFNNQLNSNKSKSRKNLNFINDNLDIKSFIFNSIDNIIPYKDLYSLKIILLFHLGNIDVLKKIISKFPEIKNIPVILTYYDDNYLEQITNFFKKIVKIIKVENKGTDCGPMLLKMKYLLSNINYINDKTIFLKIHTKSIDNWRDDLIKEILYPKKLNFDFNVPFIFGNNKYIYSDSKGINRKYIFNIIERNEKNNLPDLNYYYDIYYDELINNNNNNKYCDLIPSKDFYKNYEPDLKNINGLEHWNNHGKNEFHRISNINYIKKFAKYENKFIAGTIFGFNKKWLELYKNFDLDYEYSILESGHVTNQNLTKIHSWEYFFGSYTLFQNGKIYGIDNNKIVNTTNCSILKKEKTIYNQLNVPYNQSNIAFFLIIPGSIPNSGGYRTLLKYINYLNKKNYNCDLYFGICWNDLHIYYNYYDLNEDGMPSCKNWLTNNNIINNIINNIKKYNEIDISKNNFYLGLKCQKEYDIIYANAWQISLPVYLNRTLSKKIVYIIQDREELFYNDEILKSNVRKTYKNDFHYFCITKYLANYFKNSLKMNNVESSQMGVDLNKYYNKNKDREFSVVIPYYGDIKLNRLPRLVEKIINVLVKNNIKCYIYPEKYKGNVPNVINLGTLNEEQLNDLYNKAKVGIIFSVSNPSRLGLEMYASGLNVIEYDSIFTEYDFPNKYFTKIKDEKNILDIVKNLFKKEYDNEFIKEIDINFDFKKFYDYSFKFL